MSEGVSDYWDRVVDVKFQHKQDERQAADIYLVTPRELAYLDVGKALAAALKPSEIASFDTLSEAVSDAIDFGPKLILANIEGVDTHTLAHISRLRAARLNPRPRLMVRVLKLTDVGLHDLMEIGADDIVSAVKPTAALIKQIKDAISHGPHSSPFTRGNEALVKRLQGRFLPAAQNVPSEALLEKFADHYKTTAIVKTATPGDAVTHIAGLLPLTRSQFAFYGADVTGPPLFAATQINRLNGLIHSSGYDRQSPASVCDYVQAQMAHFLAPEQRVSLVWGVADISRRTVSLAGSGFGLALWSEAVSKRYTVVKTGREAMDVDTKPLFPQANLVIEGQCRLILISKAPPNLADDLVDGSSCALAEDVASLGTALASGSNGLRPAVVAMEFR